MKKILLALIIFLITGTINGQIISKNKTYSLIDSVDLNSKQIYSKTKFFISDTWNSGKSVTDLDDEASGVIMIKAKEDVVINIMGVNHYIFDYTVIFRMKDKKYKIEIKDIANNESYVNTTPIGKLYLSYNALDNCPSSWKTNAPKKKVIESMSNLDNLFNTIIEDYATALSKNDILDDF